jgi:hypothetical protein
MSIRAQSVLCIYPVVIFLVISCFFSINDFFSWCIKFPCARPAYFDGYFFYACSAWTYSVLKIQCRIIYCMVKAQRSKNLWDWYHTFFVVSSFLLLNILLVHWLLLHFLSILRMLKCRLRSAWSIIHTALDIFNTLHFCIFGVTCLVDDGMNHTYCWLHTSILWFVIVLAQLSERFICNMCLVCRLKYVKTQRRHKTTWHLRNRNVRTGSLPKLMPIDV